MSQDDSPKIENAVLPILIAVAAVSLLLPLLYVQMIRTTPARVLSKPIRGQMKVALSSALIAGLLYALKTYFPELANAVVIPGLSIKARVIIGLGILNSGLFSIVYLSAPWWATLLPKKELLRENLF